jgi:hypothetical protein
MPEYVKYVADCDGRHWQYSVYGKMAFTAWDTRPERASVPDLRQDSCSIGETDVTALGLVVLLVLAAYWLGFRDGLVSRPPVWRGTYDSGEHDDRVDDYGDDWI